jgi:hypothetical protein
VVGDGDANGVTTAAGDVDIVTASNGADTAPDGDVMDEPGPSGEK